MYTESELRAALEHSASRADALLDDVLPISPAHAGPQPGRRRTVGAALAVAATVAAAAAGVAVWAGGAHGPDRHQAATSQPATPTVSHSASPTRPALDLSGLVDVVDATPDDRMPSSYDLAYAPGVEEFSQPTGPGPSDPQLTIDVVTPKAGLDATRIPRDRPVRIAGTTGYYSNFKLFPIDGSKEDKYLSRWNIAFRHGDDWVFAWLQTAVIEDGRRGTNSVDDPGRIVRLFDQYGVTFGRPVGRLPFRPGWLPEGLTARVSFQRGPGSTGVLAESAGVDVSAGRSDDFRDLYISVVETRYFIDHYCYVGTSAAVVPDPASGCDHVVKIPSRAVGKYTVYVTPTGFDSAVAQKVLDDLDIADLNDPSTFWSVQDALG